MVKSYKLILESGPNAGTEFPLEKDELYLGRDVNNDIVVNDPEVSRRHARLVKKGEDYFFEDMGSTNGTFILGLRLSKPVSLQPDTKITIGERVQLSYIVESTDPSATVIAPRRAEPVIQRPPVAPMPPVQTPPAPPVQPSYIPPAPPVYQASSTPPPMAQPRSAAPVYPGMPVKKKSKAGLILLVIVAILVVFCVLPFVIIELTDNWCNLFPWIFQPMGACM
jgi:hypothetical protein